MPTKKISVRMTSDAKKKGNTRDEKFMFRCIQLGKSALGTAAPNPMVGCVIVHNDTIIGEGYTSPYGGPHAEANAIDSVRDTSLLSEATLYVTLEPCSHFGKTPPCADLILKHTIPEVVIGLRDPHEKVAGSGIQKLRDSGCRVTTGVLQHECRQLHKRFLTFHEQKRPYIILKWAESRDGFMAPESKHRNHGREPFWITNRRSRQLVHQWRSEEQAILAGTNTIVMDNPKLNTREWHGKSPVRVVLDKELKIRRDSNVYDGSEKTIVITQAGGQNNQPKTSYEVITFTKKLGQQICEILYKHQLLSVIVEGGSQTLSTFIEEDLWDEARIFTGNVLLHKGLKAPEISGSASRSLSIEDNSLNVITHG